MCRWTFALIGSSLWVRSPRTAGPRPATPCGSPCLAAGGQEAHQRRDRIPPHGIVDVPLFLPALDQPGPPQLVEVVGQRGPGYPHRLLDLSGRDLALGAHQEEEHLQSREVGEGLERLHVRGAGLELGKREPRYRFHVSKYINLWNRCQEESFSVRGGVGAW